MMSVLSAEATALVVPIVVARLMETRWWTNAECATPISTTTALRTVALCGVEIRFLMLALFATGIVPVAQIVQAALVAMQP